MDTLIDVIIPVYNIENYIEQTVESIKRQTISDYIRIILVDDGSTDESGNICDMLSEKFNNILVIHQQNKGVSSARNLGISMVKSDYFAFVDGDDNLEPDMYEILLNNIIKYNADISSVGFLLIDEYGRKYPNKGTNKKIVLEKESILNDLFNDNIVNTNIWTKLFKTNKFKNLRFDEEYSIGEDGLFSFKAFLMSDSIVYEDVCKYTYKLRTNSLITGKFSMRNFDIIKVSQEILNIVNKEYPNWRFEAKYRFFNSKLNILKKLIQQSLLYRKKFNNKEILIRNSAKKMYREIHKNRYISLEDKIIIFYPTIYYVTYRNMHRLKLFLKRIYFNKKYKK